MSDAEPMAVLLPLAGVWALAVLLPGPNFLVIVWTAAAHGRRAALAAAAGVLTGAAFWIAAGLFGLQALFVALPVAGTAIKLAGAAYLIFVGAQMVFVDRAATPPARPRAATAYRAGLATTLANPKSAAVAASLLAVALPPGAPAWLSAEAFAMLLVISATWYLLLAAAGSAPAVARGFLAARRGVTRVTGALFILFGARLALER